MVYDNEVGRNSCDVSINNGVLFNNLFLNHKSSEN